MTETEFHQEKIRLIPGIITGFNNYKKLCDLYYQEDPENGSDMINIILDQHIASNKQIEGLSKAFNDSKDFLNKAGIAINYEPRRTRREWEEDEAWRKINIEPYLQSKTRYIFSRIRSYIKHFFTIK